MRATFLRPPAGPAEYAADALRAVGLFSVLIAFIGWSAVDAAVFGLVMLGLVIPRFLGARAGLDLAFGIVVLVAGWSAVTDLYLVVRWWDLPIHFALNGLLAAVCYLLLIRLRYVPDPNSQTVPLPATVTLTVALGLAAGVLWEIGEWAGHTFVDETIFVGYNDSIGDLAVGGAGSLIAGLAGRHLVGRSRFVSSRVPAASLAV